MPADRSGVVSFISIAAGLCAVVTVAFFVLAGIAVGHRSATAAPPAAPRPVLVVTAPTPVARPAPTPRRQAIVAPNGYPTGVVRARPDFNSAKVADIPAGTPVEAGESATGPGQQGTTGIWYRVRASPGGRAVDGWMHSDILRF